MTSKRFLVPLAGALLCGAPALAETIGQIGPPSNAPGIATLPAIAGHAWVHGDQACFYSSWARVRNSCTTTKKFLVAGRNSAQSTTVIAFSAAAESSAGGVPPLCRVVVNDPGNGLVAQTAANSVLPGPAATPLGSASVSADATFHFDCDIGPDAQQGFGLAVVSWSPGESEFLGFVSSPAITGHAWLEAKQSCFASGWAGVENSCATTEKFLVPLNLAIPGDASQPFGGPWPFHLAVAAENDPARTVLPTCRAVMNDAANGFIAQSSPVAAGKGPATTDLGVLSTAGGTSTSAHLDCNIAPRSQSGVGLSLAAWYPAPTL
jgi:hypothetical protein